MVKIIIFQDEEYPVYSLEAYNEMRKFNCNPYDKFVEISDEKYQEFLDIERKYIRFQEELEELYNNGAKGCPA